jgi:predicted exporter
MYSLHKDTAMTQRTLVDKALGIGIMITTGVISAMTVSIFITDADIVPLLLAAFIGANYDLFVSAVARYRNT